MGTKVELPRGQWAEICDPEDVTREQDKTYQRYVDKALFPDGGQITYVPDPENPAVVLPVEPKRARLTADHLISLREMVHGWCITSWSYDLPVSAESFGKIPAMASDLIEAALAKAGVYEVFNGTGPKETKETEPTSSPTSQDTEPTLPQE